jgi:hypothetical protein
METSDVRAAPAPDEDASVRDQANTPDTAGDEDPLETLFADDLLHALVQGLPSADTDSAEQKVRRKTAALYLLHSFDTQQPIEDALATQAVLAHHAALAAYRRAAREGEFSDTVGRETGSAARMSNQFRYLLRELAHRQNRPARPTK